MLSQIKSRSMALLIVLLIGSITGLLVQPAYAGPVSQDLARPEVSVEPAVVVMLGSAMVEEFDARTGVTQTEVYGDDSLMVSEAAAAVSVKPVCFHDNGLVNVWGDMGASSFVGDVMSPGIYGSWAW